MCEKTEPTQQPMVPIPTLAGDRSDEAPILLVAPENAATMAAIILEKDKERKAAQPH